MPVELARSLAKLKPMLDMEYSKLFRRGIDLVVKEDFVDGKIDRKTYDEYWNVIRLFKDEDFSGKGPDLDREPTDEEIRSAWLVKPLPSSMTYIWNTSSMPRA
jgi:hypothetical protein